MQLRATAALAATFLTLCVPASAKAGEGCAPSCGASAASALARGESDLLATAKAAGSFRTLLAAVEAAGLAPALSGEGPFTIFAPTDEAFAALPAGTVEALLAPEKRAELARILRYHVVPARVLAAQALQLDRADTLAGQRLALVREEGALLVGGARVVRADVLATNGVIHVVDRVLLPSSLSLVETAAGSAQLTTLVRAVQAAGLVEALEGEGPFTVIAPSDAAFAALPAGTLESLLEPGSRARLADVLRLHVIPGRLYADGLRDGQRLKTLLGQELEVKVRDGQAWIGGARVVASDVQARNGVAHVVDAVLLPR